MTLPPQTRAFLARPDLARLWTAVHHRLERNGIQPSGSIRLTGCTAAEREALSLLLGRRVTTAATTIPLADLDSRLRDTAADCGLAATVEQLGLPLTDLRAARDTGRQERTALWTAAEAAVAASPLTGQDWVGGWLDDLRRTGALGRLAPQDAVDLLHRAIRVLSLLRSDRGEEAAPYGRGELATRVTGTAHGLDDDTVLSRLVLRGLARATGSEPPEHAPGRRALWRAAAVVPDEVSSTVLTYGLRPVGRGWRERALRERADHRAETHLTLRELRELDVVPSSDTLVHICENPRVVEAAAEARCGGTLVCTSGSASTVVLELLDTLAAAGLQLRYHGDFDWPGITLANRVIRRYAALPWRMAAEDYEQLAAHARDQGSPGLPLVGVPVEASWDADLAAAMTALNVALHEESALDRLIADLAPGTP
ncbi:TIGR02679 family protein [Kitasatospora sp. YST-16]|uniref:TIGR02679 family protein n=1 Tax=Kitasatospora sp. YST-16 TaxID=2998080 RepID=UPI002283B53E|nr:TIGR02679 family protein [Kitasatospora sp. YST-16]WAL74694.1 TIGR02679 family protein [Kitasatospora sp. YST-16]WNW40748.1 TIGR02679 family protein [Streptomyces sp. Li-HN-5-13]